MSGLLMDYEKYRNILKAFRIIEISSSNYRQQVVDFPVLGITFETRSYFS